MSFNKDLGDNGLDFIIKALPKSTSAIAFVDCGLTDVSEKKLLIGLILTRILKRFIWKEICFQRI